MVKRIFKKKKGTPKVKPPQFPKGTHQDTRFGDTRIDEYHELRDPKFDLKKPKKVREDIRKHLDAENAYSEDFLKSCAKLTEQIGDEYVGRIIEDDSSIPAKHGPYEYWFEYEKGGDYPLYKRRHIATDKTAVYFDKEKEAAGHDFYKLAALSHSPDHKYIAYAVDTNGSEYFEIRIRDLETGKDLPAVIPHTSGGVVWSEDSKTIFYTELDDNHRGKFVKMHNLGDKPEQDKTIFEETNITYHMGISKTRSKRYITIYRGDSETNEELFFESNDKDPKPVVFRPEEKGVKYSIEDHGDKFYIHTNKDGATEYKIMTAPINDFADDKWVEYLAHRDDVTLEDIIMCKDYMVRLERENALQKVIVDDFKGNVRELKIADAAAYELSAGAGYEYDTDKIRAYYDTMANPGSVFEVDLRTGDKKLLKQEQLPNGHDPSQYVIERFEIDARDGEKVPVTILRHKSTKADGSSPLHVYGYGSYGHSIDPGFWSSAVSFADRGAIFAIAHVRGGGFKGENWHFAGKKETKMNTFTDFIDVTEALIEKGWGKTGEVSMAGGSAGGMLMGAVMNARPDLYRTVVAQVPFVDVLNTILDESLPLTPGEWEEWGNPVKSEEFYKLIQSYSPYDNIKGVEYPMVYVKAGLTDPRVTYWEPAKWVLRLRDIAKGGPFVMKMDMGAGHGGKTARYEKVRERADECAVAVKRWQDLGYDMSLRVKYSTPQTKKKPAPKAKKK